MRWKEGLKEVQIRIRVMGEWRELYCALLKTVAREGITEIAPIGSRIKDLLFYCGVQFD